MVDDIIRSPTDEERRDMQVLIDPSKGNPETMADKMKVTLIQEQQRCTKLHIPFCYKAASLKATEELENYKARISSGQNTNPPLINKDWLKKYSEPTSFVLLNKQEARERVRVGIVQEQQVIGLHYDFLFKDTKFHCAVYVPASELKAFDEYIKNVEKSE